MKQSANSVGRKCVRTLVVDGEGGLARIDGAKSTSGTTATSLILRCYSPAGSFYYRLSKRNAST